MKNNLNKGFTVLEFLIVLAIIIILMAIVLPSLQTARERSLDEKRVTDLKTISLGLEQFKQACGSYPGKLEKEVVCDTDSNSTLVNFIPEIAQYNFNNPNDPGYIQYAPLSINEFGSECVAFHLGITLKNKTEGIFAVGDANIDSGSSISGNNYAPCALGLGFTIDGTKENIYDIFKQ